LRIPEEDLPTMTDLEWMYYASGRRLAADQEEQVTRGLYDSEVYDGTKFLAIVKGMVLKVDEPGTEYALHEKPKTDEECKEIWPARVDADLRIRRLKAIDLVRTLSDEEWDIIRRLKLDYVLMSNLMLYLKTHGAMWFIRLYNTGIMGSWKVFSHVGRLISSLSKRKKTRSEQEKQYFAELQALLGYQQLPFPGDGLVKPYDFFAELADLAEGGDEHGLYGGNWEHDFKTALKRIQITSVPEDLEYVDFETYTKEGLWLTAGSSSIGKVTWEFEGKLGKFKARKNMILDVYTKDELWDIIKSWDGVQRTTAIIKNELGKVRLAVASNIELYIHESFLMRQSGHLYKQWEGITLDENPTENIQRVAYTSKLFREGAFALPFDYAGFDHQATTTELQWITQDYFSFGLKTVPVQHQKEYTDVMDKTVAAYANCTITGTFKGEVQTHKVTGGLPSGVRVTSLVGNVWNGVLTRIARDIAEQILGYDPCLQVALRGDDSLIICRSPLECFAVRLGYQAVNAIGHSAKFGICKGEGEFLRTVITEEGNYGWVNRAIPSVTQRKPWNPEPWSPNHQVKTLMSNICLLERRAKTTLPEIHRANAIAWSKITGMSQHWLHLPTRLGGIGIYQFEGWIPSNTIHEGKKPEIRVNNLTPTDGPAWLTLTTSEKERYHEQQMVDKMIADDIPGVQGAFNRAMMAANAKTVTTWQKTEVKYIKTRNILLPDPHTKMDIVWPRLPNKRFVPIDNTFPSITLFLREYNAVVKCGIEVAKLATILERVYPDFFAEMKGWERKGWHRTDAVELTLGNIPCEPNPYINPLLTGYVKETLIRTGVKDWTGRRTIGERLSMVTRDACKTISMSSMGRYFDY